MINPHWCYVISFVGAILFYQLGWSKICPSLSVNILFFVFATILSHLVLGWVWKKKCKSFPRASQQVSPVAVTVFLYLLWTTEFIYEGGIPFIMIILHQPYNYRLFGIPSLHVFIVTFASFYTIFLFHLYSINRKKIYLMLYAINIAAPILIYNRGMLLFILMATVFVFLSTAHFRWLPLLLTGIISSLCFFYFFGVLGTLRESSESKTHYDPDIFLSVGQAQNSFKNSLVPKEFFWGYMYVSSPLANLQTNINSNPVTGLQYVTLQYINNEIIFDFVSKRINKLMGWEKVKYQTIPGPFNVSTVYSGSYSYQGWWGIIIMAAFLFALPWAYCGLLPNNGYALTGVSILCSMYLFLGFDNMIRFSGLSFQLVYPFVFPAFIKIKSWIENKETK